MSGWWVSYDSLFVEEDEEGHLLPFVESFTVGTLEGELVERGVSGVLVFSGMCKNIYIEATREGR